MSNNQLQNSFRASLLQLASEASGLSNVLLKPLGDRTTELQAALRVGNRMNKLTDVQSVGFTSSYELVAHYAKDASGVSMTLWRGKDGTADAGKFTVSLADGNPEDKNYGLAAALTKARGINVVELDAADKVLRNWMDGKTADGSGVDSTLSEFSQSISGSGKFDLTGSRISGHVAELLRRMYPGKVDQTYLFRIKGARLELILNQPSPLLPPTP